MYRADNGFREAPEWSEYDPAFVARYRDGQQARVARIDAIARSHLARAREAAERAGAEDFAQLPFEERQRLQRRQCFEPVMVVYRTMANLHYVDRHLDPSNREYGSLLSDRPDLMNWKALGFARTVTPRAWLSTWSANASNADVVKNLAQVSVPTLVVSAGRDREIYPKADNEPIAAAAAAADSTAITYDDARHYFEPDFGAKDAPAVTALMDDLVPWISTRFC
jgi:pimeloyl-ACP methyl ester carboxylesterase